MSRTVNPCIDQVKWQVEMNRLRSRYKAIENAMVELDNQVVDDNDPLDGIANLLRLQKRELKIKIVNLDCMNFEPIQEN